MTVTVEVVAEEYSEEAKQIEQYLIGRNRYYEKEYDSLADEDIAVSVRSWDGGMQLLVDSGRGIPSFDREWVRLALHLGYYPHGHTCLDDGSEIRWYLATEEEMKKQKGKASESFHKYADHVKYDFTDYLHNIVGKQNKVRKVEGDVYEITYEKGFYSAGEMESLLKDGGVSVQGFYAHDNAIEVCDVR